MGMELQSTSRPSPPKKSILKPSRLGGSISPFTSIRNKSIPADLPLNWRKEGKELRFELLKGDAHNVFSITHSIPLDNYMEIIHRVQEQFNCSYNHKTNLEQTYIIGNRILVFLTEVLPSHQDYQLEQNREITTTIEDDIKKIKRRLEDVALWIDLDVYYCTHDPYGVIHAGDTTFYADNTDTKQCSESTKRVKFSDKVVTVAIRNTEQDCGGNNICPPSNASSTEDTDNELGKLDLWIHRDPDLDIVNISSSSDGSSFSDQMDGLIDDEGQNWPIFESFTQNEVDSSFAFDASPFPCFDSPRIASKRVVVKIPPPIKEATTRLKRNQGRRKLKSVKQTMESSAQDHKEQNTPQHKSRHTLLENNFSLDGSQNGFEIDSNHFDAFKHEWDEFYFDPTHPTTDSHNLQVLNIGTNEASDKNHRLSTKLRINKSQNEASSSLDMTFAKNKEKHLDKVGDLEMIFSEGNYFGWNDLVANDAHTPEPNRTRHINRSTRDRSHVEDEHLSSSFSEWDDSFVSDSNNLSSDNVCHSSNNKVMSFGSSDDSAHDVDNSFGSKIEMISDDFSQSIDSSRFSKSTSSTAETDTMTTDDDIESSWCRVSKKSDCDVGSELDYLESKVKNLKIKQDNFASAGTLPTANIQDNTEATVKDLITGEGKIVRLKSLLTPTKITAKLSYENDRASPHDEIDELDLVSSSDVYSKTHIQRDNENQPSTVTNNTARISRNMTASRLRALKATSAWKRRYGNDN